MITITLQIDSLVPKVVVILVKRSLAIRVTDWPAQLIIIVDTGQTWLMRHFCSNKLCFQIYNSSNFES